MNPDPSEADLKAPQVSQPQVSEPQMAGPDVDPDELLKLIDLRDNLREELQNLESGLIPDLAQRVSDSINRYVDPIHSRHSLARAITILAEPHLIETHENTTRRFSALNSRIRANLRQQLNPGFSWPGNQRVTLRFPSTVADFKVF